MNSALLIRILSEKRAIVLPLVAALVVNVLAYFIVVRPLSLMSEGAADRAANAANALRAAEREVTAARALLDGKSGADQELQAFYQRVLPADLTAARRMTYASLPALADKNGVLYKTRATGIDDQKEDARLGHMTIRMVLQGGYGNLRKFIYALERAPEFVIIDDVTLTGASVDDDLMLSMNLSTYYRVEPNAR